MAQRASRPDSAAEGGKTERPPVQSKILPRVAGPATPHAAAVGVMTQTRRPRSQSKVLPWKGPAQRAPGRGMHAVVGARRSKSSSRPSTPHCKGCKSPLVLHGPQSAARSDAIQVSGGGKMGVIASMSASRGGSNGQIRLAPASWHYSANREPSQGWWRILHARGSTPTSRAAATAGDSVVGMVPIGSAAGVGTSIEDSMGPPVGGTNHRGSLWAPVEAMPTTRPFQGPGAQCRVVKDSGAREGAAAGPARSSRRAGRGVVGP